MKNIFAAIQFLTAFPVKVKTDFDNLKKSIVWFPLVGFLIGSVILCEHFLLFKFFPSQNELNITILLFSYVIFTRGFHLDGLADTIDAFFSYKSREVMLKIMKESTIGTFGTLALIIWAFFRFFTYKSFITVDFIFIPAISRLNILFVALFADYPRESGTGKFFVKNASKKRFLFAFFYTFLLIIFFSPLIFFIYPFILLYLFFIVSLSKRKIGGITGDVLGFTVETSDILLSVLLIFLRGLL